MIDELLQQRAALYTLGAFDANEREAFELVLQFHDETRRLVSDFSEVVASIEGARISVAAKPSASLKGRVLGRLSGTAQTVHAPGVVMSGPDGLVRWICPNFSEMCGYSLQELRGRKLGPILQGAKTDQATVESMRKAVREFRPCKETIVNYHKSGRAYWVEIAITPIFDDLERPLWFVATERELCGRQIAA
jgi:PAS domain S-box-containing protein